MAKESPNTIVRERNQTKNKRKSKESKSLVEEESANSDKKATSEPVIKKNKSPNTIVREKNQTKNKRNSNESKSLVEEESANKKATSELVVKKILCQRIKAVNLHQQKGNQKV